jgi:transcriptional regulator with XRE-family HTH domain
LAKEIAEPLNTVWVFRAPDYRAFVAHCMSQGSGRTKAHGMVQKVAEALGCHPTFVSQLMRGKSQMSVEQALLFSSYFKLTNDETHFFVLLLEKDRAGSVEAKKYFQTQMEKVLRSREAMVERIPELQNAPIAENSPFLRDWLPQAVHQVLQLPLTPNLDIVSHVLGMPKILVHKALLLLEDMGLVKRVGTSNGLLWTVLETSLHLGNKSAAGLKIHANWRAKLAQEMQSGIRRDGSLHYTAICNLSERDAAEFQSELQAFLDTWRQRLANSVHQKTCLVCLDFDVISGSYSDK